MTQRNPCAQMLVFCSLTGVMLVACDPGGEVPPPAITRIPIDGVDLRAMVMDAKGENLYVTDGGLAQVHRINLNTDKHEGTIQLDNGQPVALAVSPDARILFVAVKTSTGGSLEAIDLSDRTARATRNLGGIPTALAAVKGAGVAVSTEAGGPARLYRVEFNVGPQLVDGAVLPGSPTSERIVGASSGGTLLFTERSINAGSRVFLWDADENWTTSHDLGDLFGSSETKPGRITVSDDGRELFIFTDGLASQSANFPSCILNDAFECNPSNRYHTKFLPNGFAVSPVTGRTLITHDGVTTNQWLRTEHDIPIPDLHVFDTQSGEEIGTVALPDHVADNGLLIGPNGTIYLLLGEYRPYVIGTLKPP